MRCLSTIRLLTSFEIYEEAQLNVVDTPHEAGKSDEVQDDEHEEKNGIKRKVEDGGGEEENGSPESGWCMSDEQSDWTWWFDEIKEDALAAASDPCKVFVHGGNLSWVSKETGKKEELFYYSLNGALFVAKDSGTPWRWPLVQADPATLGLPYDPENNVDDAALTIAVDHDHLYNDTVFIKDLFHPLGPQARRWAAEVRMFEKLSKEHPHPNIVHYLGCRVVTVPGNETTGTKECKRVTGIVLEKVARCLADYDPDKPAFRDIDIGRLLTRLEATVAFLHSIGLAHNDIKPANVMIRPDGQPVLIDFKSCAPLGQKTVCQGTFGWCDSINMTSRVENDLYGLRMLRERIGSKEVERWFRVGRVIDLS